MSEAVGIDWTDGHWHVVDSSNLKAVRYDKEASAMEVRFGGNAEYTAKGVDEALYTKVISAESIGKAYNEFIKGAEGIEVVKK